MLLGTAAVQTAAELATATSLTLEVGAVVDILGYSLALSLTQMRSL
tara:strand:- start:507 stop:644 length:138 start_codon:yes stop_codon:yes gene_type:complete